MGFILIWANSDDRGDDFAWQQLTVFNQVCAEIERELGRTLIKYIANTDAIFRDDEFHLDMVRAGIALYGYSADKEVGLRPVMSLRSRVVEVQHVPKGETVDYGRKFTAHSR